MKIELRGKKYTVTKDADYEHRSHIDGYPTLEPNNWVSMHLTDGVSEYIAWYYVEDVQKTDLEDIDYDNPTDIEMLVF